MKRQLTIFLVLTSFVGFAQTGLDTMKVRSLILPADCVAWFVGGQNCSDSACFAVERAIRAKVLAAGAINWNTNITIDSMPAEMAVRWYADFKNAPAGSVAAKYTTINSAFTAKTNISYWITVINDRADLEWTTRRNRGKSKVIDTAQ